MVSTLRDRKQLKIKFLFCAAFLISLSYSWRYSQQFMYGNPILETKPFIYRQFSYQIINLFDYFLVYGHASMLFIGILSILYVSSIFYLIRATRIDIENKEILALLIFSLFCLFFVFDMKPYDISTAFLFTLALAFLAYKDIYSYLLVFMVSCVNRETTIWLTLIFVLYYPKNDIEAYWTVVFIQIFSFAIIQSYIWIAFRDVYGDFVFYFYDNLKEYVNHITASFVYFCFFVLLLVAVSRQWQYKNRLLKTSFLVLFPITFICFLLIGKPFEFRVFSEVFSTTCILLIPEL